MTNSSQRFFRLFRTVALGCALVAFTGGASSSCHKNDLDNDGVGDNVDNCPNVWNPWQTDADHDGFGNDCDHGVKGVLEYVTNELADDKYEGRDPTQVNGPILSVRTFLSQLLSRVTKSVKGTNRPGDYRVACQLEAVAFIPNLDLTNPCVNLVGKIEGHSPEFIMLGAHYDHLGTRVNEHWICKPQESPKEIVEGGPDVICNGAHDNAAAVGLVLEVASRINKRMNAEPGWKPEKTIIIALWDFEEWEYQGARSFAQNPPAGVDMDDMQIYFNFDQVGASTSPEATREMTFIFGLPVSQVVIDPTRPTLKIYQNEPSRLEVVLQDAIALQNAGAAAPGSSTQLPLDVQLGSNLLTINSTWAWSDVRVFSENYPSIWFSDALHTTYHTIHDASELDIIDFDKLLEETNLVHHALNLFMQESGDLMAGQTPPYLHTTHPTLSDAAVLKHFMSRLVDDPFADTMEFTAPLGYPENVALFADAFAYWAEQQNGSMVISSIGALVGSMAQVVKGYFQRVDSPTRAEVYHNYFGE